MIEQTMQARPSISSPMRSLLRSQRTAEIRTTSARTAIETNPPPA